MGPFTLKTAFLGLVSVLMASSSLFAALFDDHEDGTNGNEFEYYWYYYDDNAGLGANDRPLAGPATTPSVINVDYTEGPRAAYGDVTDTWVVKTYTFLVDELAGNKFGSMPFTFGDTWEAAWGDAQPFVGMGSMLEAEGSALDLTGATEVKFKIKSRSGPLAVDFKIQTLDIDQDSSFGYYQTSVAVTTDWTEVTVAIADLAQPAWAVTQAPFDFDITACTKLAWEVQKEDNLTTISDTLDVDDIEIIPFTFVSKSIWTATVPMSPVPSSGEFSTFETAPYNVCKLNTYWYAYDDGAIGGTSVVTLGATKNETTNLLLIDFIDGSGSDAVGKGAALQYALGPTIDQNGVDVQAFVGIGVNLYDSSTVRYWNASAAGASSVYFHYMTDGDAKFATMEISDVNDVGDADNPDRANTRGSGVVWYINLPPTLGAWVGVEIPFSSLLIHGDWVGANPIPLDLTHLAKLQFKVQGAENVGGIIAVDNIYFPGVTTFSLDGVGVKSTLRSAKASGLKAIHLNGNVNVSWKGNANLNNGKITLINTSGAVVASYSVNNTNKLATKFSTAKLSAGMYFVRLSAADVNGKSVVMQSPVQIVK